MGNNEVMYRDGTVPQLDEVGNINQNEDPQQ